MSLVFGRDYMDPKDAEHAPAWPSLKQVESRRRAAYQRQLKAAQSDLLQLEALSWRQTEHVHVPGQAGVIGQNPGRCWYCKGLIE